MLPRYCVAVGPREIHQSLDTPRRYAITAGLRHTCAVLDNGTVKCWGDNVAGQLGHGDIDDRGDGAGEMGDNLAPIDLGAVGPPLRDRGRCEHTCAVLRRRHRQVLGRQRLRAARLRRHRRTAATAQTRWATTSPRSTSVPAHRRSRSPPATFHTCALLDNGTVKCWGANASGQLGQGDTNDRGDGAGEMGDDLAPIDLGTGRTATAIAAGGFSHVCAARRRHRQVLGGQRRRAARLRRHRRPGRRRRRDGRQPRRRRPRHRTHRHRDHRR